jgi:hypothetical protein
MQLMPLLRETQKFNLAQAWSITENSDRDFFEPIVVVDEVQFYRLRASEWARRTPEIFDGGRHGHSERDSAADGEKYRL